MASGLLAWNLPLLRMLVDRGLGELQVDDEVVDREDCIRRHEI